MTPKIIENPLYVLLRQGKVEEFNQQRDKTAALDFSCCDFRSIDLRGLCAENIDFSNAYFRNADLRGIDFRQSQIEGASFASAQISGCYFPKTFSATELELSVSRGIRIRAV